jgi:Leucine-rich repeat (LRR) protein
MTQAASSLLISVLLQCNKDDNLELLAKCTNLRSVAINGMNNGDTPSLAPLAQCPSLEVVSLASCKWTDYGELESVTQLRSLSINGDAVHTHSLSSLAFLSGWKNLMHLDVSRCPVTDLRPLAGLTQLRTLNIVGTGVVDLSPVGRATHKFLKIMTER